MEGRCLRLSLRSSDDAEVLKHIWIRLGIILARVMEIAGGVAHKVE